VSFRALRQLAGLSDLPVYTYNRVLAEVRAQGWHREGRSFVRACPFTDETITT
jgi:hypothetical protein